MIRKVNLEQAFTRFSERWTPKIVGQVNDFHVKVAKLQGEFVWHHHAGEDELFLVVKGRLVIRLRDGEVVLGPGEFAVVPRGVEHQPVAEEECHVLLFEPATTVNTGQVEDARTVRDLDHL
jgi:mannose-6-phosphate isomerase-like protein (cupin superfamily)